MCPRGGGGSWRVVADDSLFNIPLLRRLIS